MKRTMTIGVLLAASMAMVAPALADLTFTLDSHFGDVPTQGYLVATIVDITGGVRLTMDASNLYNNEFIDGGGGWYFNFDETLTLAAADIHYDSGVQAETVQVGLNSFPADGDGYYDLVFTFPKSSPSRLGAAGGNGVAGSTSVYLIDNVSAADFYFLSDEGGGQGTYYSAAHVQATGLDGEGSDWVGYIPAPGATLLGLIGFGIVGWVKRRRIA